MSDSAIRYLNGYPQTVIDSVQRMLDNGSLAAWLQQRHPERHDIRTDKALWDYVQMLKQRYLRQSVPLSKVQYDDRIDVVHQALGLNATVSRVQGGKLKTKHEIRVGGVFRSAPLAFLRMICVHELAHLREKQHNKAFYQLCTYMEPDYAQLEFETCVYLTYLDSVGPLYQD